MRNRTKSARTPQISDFSEALLNAGAGGSQSQKYEDELQAMLNQESASAGSGNGNLSNVLNKIRDRGPAGRASRRARASQPQEQQDVVTRFSKEALATAGQEPGAESKASGEAAAATPASQHGAQALTTPAWNLRQQLPLIFMMIAIAALAAMQFYTDGKLSQLASSQQFSEQSNDLSINTALDGQQQIAQLQTTIAALGEKVQQLGDKLALQSQKPTDASLMEGLNKLEHKLESISTQQQNSIATLKKQIEALQASRATAVAKPTAVRTKSTAKAVKKAAPVKTVAAQTTTGKRGWSVNLAALSNRQLARKAMQRLKGAGVSPMIEEVELKGKKVYRLRVDGFASRQAAKNFVSKARRYGFDKGWIRKG